MTPRVAALIGLRLIALWILIQAFFGLGTVFLAMLGGDYAAHLSNPIIAPSFDRMQTSALAQNFPWRTFLPIVMRMVGGVFLWLFSNRLARLVADTRDELG